MKFSTFIAFLIAAAANASDEAGHKNTCACDAEELDFSIECSNGSILTDTLATLIQDGCSANCASEACKKNFLIIQSHHDFCLHDQIPGVIEDSFHDYDEVCEHCEIFRRRDPILTNCPASVCDGRGTDSYGAMLVAECLSDCSSTACGANYKILRTEHDNCPEGSISDSAETGIHDFEEICEPYNCNSLFTAEDETEQLICNPKDTPPSPAPTSDASVASLVAGFLVATTGTALLA
mmetsp:Transcript_3906/g.6532  ORF Transcript_3906/g.6532 Transcript_3906/m.6532 type:complete len:237 (-) Transcript_3906:86-796(-)